MNKKKKKILVTSLALGVVLCLLLVFAFGGGTDRVRKMLLNIKPIGLYTWDDYSQMSNEEKDTFFERFDSIDEFEEWIGSVQPTETEPDFHWDEPGKLPNEYTWDEYQALTPEQQEAFYQWFASKADFESWQYAAKSEENTIPGWNKTEQPDAFTWDAYLALTLEEKEAFYQWFDSEAAFETWRNSVKPAENEQLELSWDISNKKPRDYTWAEYQTLSPEDQEAFYQWFGSLKSFENWLNSVKPTENDFISDHWDKPGKQPDEYTWEEYQELCPEEQDLFYLWFNSMEDFEAWMDQAKQEKD